MATDGYMSVRTKDRSLADSSRNIGKVSRSQNTINERNATVTSPGGDSDSDVDVQTTPMLSPAARVNDVGRRQVETHSLSHLSGEKINKSKSSHLTLRHISDKNMDLGGPPKPISPTGKLAWVGFGLSVGALACMCISFASPYWLQQWELSFNTFNNMGLWEACFHNYMHHRDDLQEIYNGCFWVYNPDERYNKLRDWLVPPWFISCQVMCTIILLVLIAVVIMMALVFLHICPMMSHEYHQIFTMFISGAMLFLVTMTTLITAILFGVQIQDRNWMPRPDWNMLSWGYGFLIICGIFSLGAGFALFISAWKSYNELLRNQDQYFKHAMDMATQFQPSMSQASYGPTYSDKPSYSAQPSYQSQPSYEKEGFVQPQAGYGQPQPGYDQPQPGYDKPKSQSSYGGEKAPYEQQQSYESRGRQEHQEQVPTYDAAKNQPQYGYNQPQYEADRSYDSRGDRSYDSRGGGYNDQQGYGYDQHSQHRA